MNDCHTPRLACSPVLSDHCQYCLLIESCILLQFGSYFGYAVEVEDLDNNGLDDVIVGAPLFSDFGTDNTYETGRVYIYYQNSKVCTLSWIWFGVWNV